MFPRIFATETKLIIPEHAASAVKTLSFLFYEPSGNNEYTAGSRLTASILGAHTRTKTGCAFPGVVDRGVVKAESEGMGSY
ncbi:hypothetical protein K443DRAFT_433077 [Laccaria amethystina LaAM-08-1]|jgi:hypothetical protein|uniref:Uncharacterized protein n=1 Tax=Laccaria amethystina LaAM-08-1 TaxID=1095629 RepID=A0A0C9Y845_9AGAR|nr:hypothetical protein K443DRAFT_433077 [Laccaria amethystina LaAM-08-1]